MNVKVGDRIKKGQILAELNQDLMRAQMAELAVKAESTVLLDFAEHAVKDASHKLQAKAVLNERLIEAGRSPLFTDDEMTDLKLGVVRANAELRKVREDTQLCKLRLATHQTLMKQYVLESPVNGIVTHAEGTAGVTIEPSTVVLTVMDPTVLSAICRVLPKDIRRITRGMRVEFRPNAHLKLDLDPIYGSVLGFSSQAAADSDNSIEVHCELHNPHEHIRTGTFGEAVFLSPVVAKPNEPAAAK